MGEVISFGKKREEKALEEAIKELKKYLTQIKNVSEDKVNKILREAIRFFIDESLSEESAIQRVAVELDMEPSDIETWYRDKKGGTFIFDREDSIDTVEAFIDFLEEDLHPTEGV